jgi:hypothetical protein
MGLSAQSSLPGRRCRVPYAEGKPACAESTRLSAKAANPIVSTANHDVVACWSSSPPSPAGTPSTLRSQVMHLSVLDPPSWDPDLGSLGLELSLPQWCGSLVAC